MRPAISLTLVAALAWTVPGHAQNNDDDPAVEEPQDADSSTRDLIDDLLEQLATLGYKYVPAESLGTSKPVVGIGFTKDGADMRVAQVVAGSSAEAAGMMTGTVIRRINGVKVDAFSVEELAKLLGAIDGEIDFEMEGGEHHRLTKAPIPVAARIEE